MKTLETRLYNRKQFQIEAVQVTLENAQQVADWCGGDVRHLREGLKPEDLKRYIKVRVHRPLTPRQTMAFVGDWVLYAGTGYKVYTDKAFQNSFENDTEGGVTALVGAGAQMNRMIGRAFTAIDVETVEREDSPVVIAVTTNDGYIGTPNGSTEVTAL